MDFCNEALGTTVSASQVSTDTYEVTNLISPQRSSRGRGFMVERFIKPPVDITFTFACAVELHQIVLCTAVGCQRSVGIDVLALRRNTVAKKPPAAATAVSKPTTGESPYEETVIAKVFLQEGEDRVCFLNRRYRPRAPFNEWSEASPPDGIPTREMRDLPGRVLGLRLRLWRSAAGSLLAMKSVLIQAAPSHDTPDHVVSRLVAVIRPPSTVAATSGNSATVAVSTSTSSSTRKEAKEVVKRAGQYDYHSSQQAKVPAEFVDPLTCELMTFPVILPSGNTVDQSSLDRHVQSESRWGRLPSDPFTGLPLLNSDSKRRVLPNTLLKTRIDRYLLLNAGILTGEAGRATGGKRSWSDGPGGGHDKQQAGVTTAKLSRILNGRCDPTVPAYEAGPSTTTGNRNAVPLHGEQNASSIPPTQQSVSETFDQLSACSGSEKCETSGDHKLRLDSSLDSALKSALSSLTKFSGAGSSSRGTRWARVFSPPPGCVGSCGTATSESPDSNRTPLYRLPCSHLLCRNCATTATSTVTVGQQPVCPACRISYTNTDLSRVHLG